MGRGLKRILGFLCAAAGSLVAAFTAIGTKVYWTLQSEHVVNVTVPGSRSLEEEAHQAGSEAAHHQQPSSVRPPQTPPPHNNLLWWLLALLFSSLFSSLAHHTRPSFSLSLEAHFPPRRRRPLVRPPGGVVGDGNVRSHYTARARKGREERESNLYTLRSERQQRKRKKVKQQRFPLLLLLCLSSSSPTFGPWSERCLVEGGRTSHFQLEMTSRAYP